MAFFIYDYELTKAKSTSLMPIYEYICESCGERLEVLQKISDQPLCQCPACHKETLKKLVSAAGFRLAGKGWYETDFKTQNQRNLANTQEPKADANKAKDTSKKTDSTPSQTANAKSSTPKPQTTRTAKTSA